MNIIAVFLVALIIFYTIEQIYYRFWDYNLKIKMNFSKQEAFVDDELVLNEVVINNKPLPIPVLLLKFYTSKYLQFEDVSDATISDNYYRNDLLSVMMYQKIHRQLKFRCTHRGTYDIENVVLVTYNIFFSEKVIVQFPLGIDLVVYPKIIDTTEFNILFKSILGEVVTNRSLIEDPFEFSGVRDYRISDSMKFINWKASAKCMDLKVNKLDFSISQKVRIIVNVNTDDYSGSDILEETSISLAASFANSFLSEGISVSCFVNAKDKVTKQALSVPTNTGEQHLKLILFSLARLDLEGQTTIDFYQIGNNLINDASKNEWIIFISPAKNHELQKLVIGSIPENNSLTWICPAYKGSFNTNNDFFKNIIPWYVN